MRTASGAVDADLSFASRFEDGSGTNPEELIASAHAGCFSMALSKMLSDIGHPPDTLHTRAKVTLESAGDGFEISRIHLHTRGVVPGLDEAEFQRRAGAAKDSCPVSKALSVREITLEAELAG